MTSFLCHAPVPHARSNTSELWAYNLTSRKWIGQIAVQVSSGQIAVHVSSGQIAVQVSSARTSQPGPRSQHRGSTGQVCQSIGAHTYSDAPARPSICLVLMADGLQHALVALTGHHPGPAARTPLRGPYRVRRLPHPVRRLPYLDVPGHGAVAATAAHARAWRRGRRWRRPYWCSW